MNAPAWTSARYETVEAHTGGEPLRILCGELPAIPGDTILAKRAWARAHLEDLRRALMWEPRGHADMYGALPTEPVTEDGDLGVLFLHNEGWSTMCGHGIIALVSAGLELGLFRARDPRVVRLDTPAGRVTAYPELADGRVRSVRFENVPSFVCARDLEVRLADGRTCRVDVAYGGAFYAYADARALGVRVRPDACEELVRLGRDLKRAVAQAVELAHPSGEADLNFLYGAILCEEARGDEPHRNVCVFADGEVDRSPTGTGVSGRAALLHARGQLELGDWVRIESVLGSAFDVRAARELRLGAFEAIVPEVRGSAHVVGRAEWWIDPTDALGQGFLLR